MAPNILSRIDATAVSEDPFPHIAVENAVDHAICAQLRTEFPGFDKFRKWRELPLDAPIQEKNNRRMDVTSAEVLQDDGVSPVWREFVRAHTSADFFRDFVRVFDAAIDRHYPDFKHSFGNPGDLRVGVEGVDTFDTVDVLLSAAIGMNTPVLLPDTSVRGPHIDQPRSLFAALLYLRDPADHSTGGEFELYKFRGRPQYSKNEIAQSVVDKVKAVPYRDNTLVMFLNTPHAVHGVSPRQITEHPRRFLVVSGYFRKKLFDHSRYQTGARKLGFFAQAKSRLRRILAAGTGPEVSKV